MQANPIAGMLGMPQGRGGRVKLNSDLSVPDYPEIFVVGDMGEVTSEGTFFRNWDPWPCSQANTWADRSLAESHEKATQPFKYWDKGFMATIGRGSAVVEFPTRRTLHRPLAYFAWLGVHRITQRSAKQDRDAMEVGLVRSHA